MKRVLRVAIDCRIANIQQGHGSAIPILAHALSVSDRSGQEYTFIVNESAQAWLAPYIAGPSRLVGIPESALPAMRARLRSVAPLRHLWRKLQGISDSAPSSDGYVEAQGFDIVHFPTQWGYTTSLPTIYQPWDLQHLHYPEFFSAHDFRERERLYRSLCSQAECICVQTEWTKRDIQNRYDITSEKLTVIPWATIFEAGKSLDRFKGAEAIQKYSLPDHYFFYPAATWPHKNHQVILHAIHRMRREKQCIVHVVFSGMSTEYRHTLNNLVEDLGIPNQVHFVGYVSRSELQAIFARATALIFPSKFEGFGLPIFEAFCIGVPVISSTATTLPEVGQDAALYFSPDDSGELVDAMEKILKIPELRRRLIQRGKHVLSMFTAEQMGDRFYELYRKVSCRNLTRS